MKPIQTGSAQVERGLHSFTVVIFLSLAFSLAFALAFAFAFAAFALAFALGFLDLTADGFSELLFLFWAGILDCLLDFLWSLVKNSFGILLSQFYWLWIFSAFFRVTFAIFRAIWLSLSAQFLGLFHQLIDVTFGNILGLLLEPLFDLFLLLSLLTLRFR